MASIWFLLLAKRLGWWEMEYLIELCSSSAMYVSSTVTTVMLGEAKDAPMAAWLQNMLL